MELWTPGPPNAMRVIAGRKAGNCSDDIEKSRNPAVTRPTLNALQTRGP